MRFERLDLNLLVALNALIEECNVSAAAQRLCLSQSAMSGALARLRDFFGDELLVNTGRRMVLTPRAETLAEPVRAVLAQIKSTITTPPAFDPSLSDRHFVIAASDYAISVMLAGALQRVSRMAPGISIEIAPLDDRLTERVERREIDLLITLRHAISPTHPSAPFFKDDYVVVAWNENARLKTEGPHDFYADFGHVTVNFGKARLPAFEEFLLRERHVRRRIEVVAPSFTAVPAMVVGTDRIAIVQSRLAHQAAATQPITIYPAPGGLPPIEQMIQWHRASEHDASTVWLVDQLRAHAAEAAAGTSVHSFATAEADFASAA
jgi:LysR family nod box-dependent transcriptional activator